MGILWQAHDALIDLLVHGLTRAPAWQVALATLAMTHLTIVGVTLFLHRAQAHRALELGAPVAHVLRLWLWLTTGMVTREWVAIHRKHHAKCETPDDPHSPVTRGMGTVLLTGAELYRAEARNAHTLEKYGRGTPDDWVERNVYTRFSRSGVALMLVIDLLLFGALGLAVWAVQMAWIPVNAAGVINGLGHGWGYRNFEPPDASTNISPWGLVIGGEELHNNHHTYPTSAKFSVRAFEFDLGWLYIRLLQGVGMAHPRKVPPRMRWGSAAPVADGRTLEALIANRYEVMARYAAEMRRVAATELVRVRALGAVGNSRVQHMRLARTWLHRDEAKIPHGVRPSLALALGDSPKLAMLLAMREDLRRLWTRTNVSAEQLVADLQAWCRQAEDSGIAALHEFSLSLRAARV